MRNSYAIRSFWLAHRTTHAGELIAVLFKKQEKGFKRAKLRVWGSSSPWEKSRGHIMWTSPKTRSDLFDGRGPSSSEDVTLEEEEGIVVTGGGRLLRFLNLLSKLRFPNDKGHRAEVSTITHGRSGNTCSRTVAGAPPVSSSRARPTQIKVKGAQLSVERSAPISLPA